MFKVQSQLMLGLVLISTTIQLSATDTRRFPNLGSAASEEQINRWDIAIGPNGGELPAGQGTVAKGREVYAVKCAYCHGATGKEGPDPRLVGGKGTLNSEHPVLTIGSYWPYATTLYDYINRAMPPSCSQEDPS
ncbi:MAG: cytochrome c, partial [Pseudomonadota bacterium]